MDAPFKKGAAVRQKVVAIEGTVSAVRYDDGYESFMVTVDYTDAAGEVHTREFKQGDFELKEQA